MAIMHINERVSRTFVIDRLGSLVTLLQFKGLLTAQSCFDWVLLGNDDIICV